MKLDGGCMSMKQQFSHNKNRTTFESQNTVFWDRQITRKYASHQLIPRLKEGNVLKEKKTSTPNSL